MNMLKRAIVLSTFFAMLCSAEVPVTAIYKETEKIALQRPKRNLIEGLYWLQSSLICLAAKIRSGANTKIAAAVLGGASLATICLGLLLWKLKTKTNGQEHKPAAQVTSDEQNKKPEENREYVLGIIPLPNHYARSEVEKLHQNFHLGTNSADRTFYFGKNARAHVSNDAHNVAQWSAQKGVQGASAAFYYWKVGTQRLWESGKQAINQGKESVWHSFFLMPEEE